MNVVRVQAPAKLNLGLEVLGRRSDGYHEIRTVLAMIDYLDTITVEATPNGMINRRTDVSSIDERDDLTLRALKKLQIAVKIPIGATVSVDKRIPVSAGLGGASSDAAAALVAGRRAWRVSLEDQLLNGIAAELGTDVPFFLNGPCSLARGIGTTLEPLPPLHAWAVIATPPIPLQRKTTTLYSALARSDFTDGSRIDAVVSTILRSELPQSELLANAFLRPLLRLIPELTDLAPAMRHAGAPSVALSGAGGTHYTLTEDRDKAMSIASRLRDNLPPGVQLAVVPLRSRGLVVEEWSVSYE